MFSTLEEEKSSANWVLPILCEHLNQNSIHMLSMVPKIRQVGLHNHDMRKSLLECLTVPDMSPRCLVHLVELYLNNLPQRAFDNDLVSIPQHLIRFLGTTQSQLLTTISIVDLSSIPLYLIRFLGTTQSQLARTS